MTLQDIGWLLLTGKVLSALSLALLLAALIDARRRQAYPEVAYGGLSLSVSRVRVLWIGVLLGSAILGVGSDPLANSSNTLEDMEDEQGQLREGRIVTSSLAFPLPFYRYVVTRTHIEGHLVREETVESFLIPKAFLVVLLAYWALVVRWNSESRLALRILNGPKRD